MKKDVEIEEYIVPILRESPCRRCHKVCDTLCETGDQLIARIIEIEEKEEEEVEDDNAMRILCA